MGPLKSPYRLSAAPVLLLCDVHKLVVSAVVNLRYEDSIKRFEALARYGVLDTPPEPEFDEIVQMARTICATPVALVSLVAEDRQWFKARVGFAPCETPLAQSVCAYALTSADLFIIPDLARDSRTAGNTLVTGEPFIRFYAGAPLMTPEGVALGSLCVIDVVPRPEGLTPDQQDLLRSLARQTMTILNLRAGLATREDALVAADETHQDTLYRALQSEAATDRLREAESMFRDAQTAARIGAFEIEIAGNRFQASPEFCRIFGLPNNEFFDAAEVEDLILLQDRSLVASSRQTRREGLALMDVEYRIRRRSDGALRWISRRSAFEWNANGDPVRMLGVVQDITERKLGELRNEALVSLGDQLRGATTTLAAGKAASLVLGQTLAGARAGYAIVDEGQNTYTVEFDWVVPGIASIAGTSPSAPFRTTIDKLKEGIPFVVANVPAATWLADDAPAYAAASIAAQVNVPLIENGALVGLVFVHNALPRTWSRAEIDFAVAVADRTYATIAKIKAEEHQRVLNEELSHRLKNTMSLVQAIINQTLRGNAERSVIKAVENRIVALSKAHDVLLQQSWTAAPIIKVIDSAASLHGRQDRLDVCGPDVTLGPKATLALSLLMHELTTNSIKYGALSVTGGRVHLTWRVDSDGAEPTITMIWAERGGPPTVAPTRKGFGSRLISMGLGAGTADLNYRPDGLHAVFAAPLRLVSTV